MKHKKFAGQPEVMEVLTGRNLISEVNPSIIASEDIFKPSQNFSNFVGEYGYGYSSEPSDISKINWWEEGLGLFKTGIGLWSQSEKSKAEREQAEKAERIAELEYKREQERLKAQQIKTTTFRRYGVPIIITSVILVAGISAFVILRKKKNV
jgi:hypothetical protein